MTHSTNQRVEKRKYTAAVGVLVESFGYPMMRKEG
jgi:hypothetical protein